MIPRLGVLLPHFGARASSELILQTAAAAEEAGFDSVWVRDHLVYQPHPQDDPDPTFYEAFTTLAFVAGATRRVALGTAAAIPFRDPLSLSRIVASLSSLSNRPVELGIGAGLHDVEFQLSAVAGSSLSARAESVLRETVEVLRQAWTGALEGPVGGHYPIPPAATRPVPPVAPRIWYCGTSPRSVRFGASWCDGWIPGRITSFMLARRLGEVKEPPRRVAAIPLVALGADPSDALRAVDVGALLAYANRHRWLVPASGDSFQTVADLDGLLLRGSPSDIGRQAAALAAAGATDVILDFRLALQHGAGDLRDPISQIGSELAAA